ncbi:PhzF family phenazine biosynthesis protein [soil metagenome]
MVCPFHQVDVFTSTPFGGNPLAVVLDADGLTTAQMQQFAAWTNLSETTFVLPPADPAADYRVRIFTPVRELPFAGHPTLGTCHTWLQAGGIPADTGEIVQECGAGLIRLRQTDVGLAFAAPPLVRSGPVDAALVERIAAALGVEVADIVDAQWADNGPGWVAVLLGSAEAVLALRPTTIDADVGVVGTYPPGGPAAIEVRAFCPKDGAMAEDPVTGSLNASVAQWLLDAGRLTAPYVASQGTAIGRAGRVHITRDDDGTIWVGGATTTRITGTVTFVADD